MIGRSSSRTSPDGGRRCRAVQSARTTCSSARRRDCLRRAMSEAVRELDLDYWQCITQPSGDGRWVILPIGSAEPPVVAYLATTLNRLLGEYNRSRSSEARVRIRIALHVGLVHLDGPMAFQRCGRACLPTGERQTPERCPCCLPVNKRRSDRRGPAVPGHRPKSLRKHSPGKVSSSGG